MFRSLLLDSVVVRRQLCKCSRHECSLSVVAGRIPVEVNTTSAVFHFLSLAAEAETATGAEKQKKGVASSRQSHV